MSQTPQSIEHLVLERRLSQISGTHDELGEMAPMAISATAAAASGRSPRSNSVRRMSEIPSKHPVAMAVVSVPMPGAKAALSPQNSLLLAPPSQEQMAGRRFSEVNAAIERHNLRKAAKRSQSVMYKQTRRKSVRAPSATGNGSEPLDPYDLMRRRRSVKL